MNIMPVNLANTSSNPIGNALDAIPMANIPAFGNCTSMMNPMVAAATAAAAGSIPYSFFKMSANSLTSLTDKFTNCSAKVFKSAIFLFLFYFIIYLFDNVWRMPESFPPPDESAEITFLAGDCNNMIISPINSSFDLIANNVSSWSSPI